MNRLLVKPRVALTTTATAGVLVASIGCSAHRPAPERAEPRSETRVTGASARVSEDEGERGPASRAEALDRLTPFAAVKDLPDSTGKLVTLSDSVLFEGKTAELMSTAQERLERVADVLREVQARSIVVKGHMDRSGDDRHDADLSRRRAEAVRTYLIAHGIDPARVRVEGHGNEDPVASNASTEGRNDNRRIELIVESIRFGAPNH